MAFPVVTSNTVTKAISWTAFSIQFLGVGYSVPASSTTKKFVWWQYNNGAPILQVDDSAPVMEPEDILLFLNKEGVGTFVPATNFVDGSLLVSGSVLADAIGANQIQAEHIVANTITAAQIATNTITANQIAANTLTADRLTIGALYPDAVTNGSFEDGVIGWEMFGNTGGNTVDVVSGVASAGAYALRMIRGTVNHVYVGQSRDYYIPVTDRPWYVSARAGAGTTLASGFYLRAYWFQADKTTAASTVFTDVVSNVGLSTNWQVFEDKVTPPADARYMRVAVINALGTNTMYVDQINAQEIVVSARIGDGAVQANNILANTITANQIATNTITANEIKGNTITANQIAVNTITATEIKGNTITANQIAANTITANEIKANTITGDVIAANTIAAKNLILADFTNLVAEPRLENGGLDWQSSVVVPVTGAFGANNALRLTGGGPSTYPSTYSLQYIETAPGEEFYLTSEAVKADAGTATLRVAAYDKNKTNTVNTQVAVAPTGSTWTTIEGSYTVPAGKYFMRVWVEYSHGTSGAYAYFTNFTLRRKSNANLIVDGAITGEKIFANTITANKIATNTITANEIAANTITANQIAANTITANEIKSNAITTDTLDAGAITAKHTITGATFQTSATANTGIKFNSGALIAYGGGQPTFSVDAATGGVTLRGDLTGGASIIGAAFETDVRVDRGLKITSAGMTGYDSVGGTTFTYSAVSGAVSFKGDINAGSNITGANITASSTGVVQTQPEASRGIKINSTGLTGFNTSGQSKFVLNASTGIITSMEVTAGTITGATFRTSATATTNGVQMTSGGITGYGGGAAKFVLNATGDITAMNVTGGTVTGGLLRTSATATTNGVQMSTAGIAGYGGGVAKFVLNTSGDITSMNVTAGTITGATVRTSATATTNGVEMTSTGIRGYSGGTERFAIDTSGNVKYTGTLGDGTNPALTGTQGIQTDAAANRGLKISSTGLEAWAGVADTSRGIAVGDKTFTLNGSTGQVDMVGSLTSGGGSQQVTISSNGAGGYIHLFSGYADELPAKLYASGGLFLEGPYNDGGGGTQTYRPYLSMYPGVWNTAYGNYAGGELAMYAEEFKVFYGSALGNYILATRSGVDITTSNSIDLRPVGTVNVFSNIDMNNNGIINVSNVNNTSGDIKVNINAGVGRLSSGSNIKFRVGMWDAGTAISFRQDWVAATHDTMNAASPASGNTVPFYANRVYGYGTYVNASDIREKNSISLVDKDWALETIQKVEINKFRMNNVEPDRDQYGVIAQQVREVLPSAIPVMSGDTLGAAYQDIFAVHVAATQALVKQVDRLQREVRALKKKR